MRDYIFFHFTLFCLLYLVINEMSFAGAPFLTNDPEPLPYHHMKVYFYSSADNSPVSDTVNVPALQLKFSALSDLELQTLLPVVDYVPHQASQKHAYGYGDTALVFKYRFIHETDTMPQVAFHPIFEMPTGNQKR